MSPSSEHFRMKLRLTTTDHAKGNVAAEQQILQVSPGWLGLSFVCVVHVLARCHTRSFELLEETVSGLINFSLSLSMGSSMVAFRRALSKVVHQGLVVKRGYPS